MRWSMVLALVAAIALGPWLLCPANAVERRKNSPAELTLTPNTSAQTTPTRAAPTKAPAKTDNTDSKNNNNPSAQKDPIPDTWSVEKIAEERQLCAQTLSLIDAISIPEASFRKGACGAPAPIRLVAVGKSPQVVLSPPAIMTCRLAAAIHRWATRDLQTLAKKHLKDEIIRIEVMSDYACRNAYGRKNGRLSEHALANALDIRGFGTAKGKNVRVLKSWGPTARDIAAEQARAKAKREATLAAEKAAKEKQEAVIRAAKQAASTQQDPDFNADHTGKNKSTAASIAKRIIAERSRDLLNVGTKLGQAAKLAVGKLANKAGRQTSNLPLRQRITRQGRFLRGAHAAACKIFGTILGPEANNAHRNHFHVDMTPRRRNNFCE